MIAWARIWVFVSLMIGPAVAGEYSPADRKPVAVSFVDRAWTDQTRGREIPYRIYYPRIGEGCPVILFSHGLGASRESYPYLGRYWASRGYVAIHLQHHGSDTPAILSDGFTNIHHRGMEIATDVNNAADRATDITFAIDQLKRLNDDANSPVHGRLDVDRVGLAGHSFGGNTALMIAGQTFGALQGDRTFRDPRVRVVVSMSPPIVVGKGEYEKSFAGVSTPAMILTGTLDNGPISRTANDERQAAFKSLTHGPAYLVTLTEGDHLTFAGVRFGANHPDDDKHYELIRAASTAMFDAYLRDDDGARRWLDRPTGLAAEANSHRAVAIAADPNGR